MNKKEKIIKALAISQLRKETAQKMIQNQNLSLEEFSSLQNSLPKTLILINYPNGIVKKKSDGKKFVVIAYEGENLEECILWLLKYEEIEERRINRMENEVYFGTSHKMRSSPYTYDEFKDQFDETNERLSIFHRITEGIDWERKI